MRFPPLLLACALSACATSGSQGPSSSTTTSAAPVQNPGAPASFVRSTAEAAAMRNIDMREGLTHQQAMRMLGEALSQRYVVDVVDPRAGFVMTTWQASLARDGVPDLRYRTRFVARFVDDWRALQLHSEARWAAHGDEADIGYDKAQLDSLAADLRVKLGKKA